MKIAMFTMGTRGDVQPYLYLSRALIKNGHEVTLGSHPCWRKLIEDAGVHFIPIGPNINIEQEAAAIRGKNSNAALSMLKTMNFVFKIIRNSTNDVYEACKGNDLIIVSHSQMGATEAEVLNIPTINVTLQCEMIAQKNKPQTFINRLIGGFIGRQMAKPYNKIRKVYGLKPIKNADTIISHRLDLIPISKYVIQRNPYWEEHHIMTGYWYEVEEEFTPDTELQAFLKGGDKPVILALGAMSFEDKAETDKLDMFVKALEKAGCRAVIQGFQKAMKDYKLPETMIACGSVPHSWLFRQGKFVIHHCGFGTTAATLVYGIPSIPIPHVLDQMGFAMQLKDVNVAVDPLKAKDLSIQTIYKAIIDMQDSYEEKYRSAKELAQKISTEGGLSEAVRLIEAASYNNQIDYSP